MLSINHKLPETETLVDVALQEPFTRVLDLGTGSGCILISLLMERPEARGEDLLEPRERLGQTVLVAFGVAGHLAEPRRPREGARLQLAPRLRLLDGDSAGARRGLRDGDLLPVGERPGLPRGG